MDLTNSCYGRKARIILSDAVTDSDALELSSVVYVVGGPFPDDMGYPHFLVVSPKPGAKPRIATRLRFE